MQELALMYLRKALEEALKQVDALIGILEVIKKRKTQAKTG